VYYLEQVSYQSFKDASHVMQTVDWMDMSVEHLSKYVKHFGSWGGTKDQAVGIAMQNRVSEILEQYIIRKKTQTASCQSSSEDSSLQQQKQQQSAVPSTIAILPLRVSSSPMQDASYKTRLLTLQTSATIASLWNVGFPRVVVVGVSENERKVAQQAFDLIKDHLEIRAMELEYVQKDLDGENDGKLVPKLAMIQFQKAVREFRRAKEDGTLATTAATNHTDDTFTTRNNSDFISSWLGADPSRWQYIYFTEPDLLLHIRPQAMPALSNELKKGHLLNAHRLQPLPHMQQFSDIFEQYATRPTTTQHNQRGLQIERKVVQSSISVKHKMESLLLPNRANFAAIHALDTVSGDTCHDQGKFYPGHVEDPSTQLAVRKSADVMCNNLWALCGFSSAGGDYSEWSFVLDKHKLLITYPFISFVQGTGLPLVHHGQRVCTPKQG